MRTRALLLLPLLAAAPAAQAGRLDLDLFGPDRVAFSGGEAAPAPRTPYPGELWAPNDARDVREEPKTVQVIAETGYTALGAVGAAQSLHGAGSSREAKEASAGFVAVALYSFWNLLKTLWN